MAKSNVQALDKFREQVQDSIKNKYGLSADVFIPSIQRALEYHAVNAETKFKLDAVQYVDPYPKLEKLICNEEDTEIFYDQHNEIIKFLGLKTIFKDEFDINMIYEEAQELVKYCTKPSKEKLTKEKEKIINAIELVKYTADVMRESLLSKYQPPEDSRKPKINELDPQVILACRSSMLTIDESPIEYFNKLLKISDLADVAFDNYRDEYALKGIGKPTKRNTKKRKI